MLDGFSALEKRTTFGSLDISLTDVRAQLTANRDLIEAARSDPTLAGRGALAATEMEFLLAEEGRILNRIGELGQKATRPTDRAWTPPTPPPGGFGSSTTTLSSTSRDKITEVLASLREEQTQLGRTSREQAIYNALARAGIADADARAAAIRAAAGSLFDEEQALTPAIVPNHKLGGSIGRSVNQVVTANITLNATGGTPQANPDLADKVSGQVKNVLRQMVAEELRVQLNRPGFAGGSEP